MAARCALHIIFRDASNSTAELLAHLGADITYVAANDALNALLSVVTTLSNAIVVKTRIVYKTTAVDIANAGISSDMKRRGVFIFDNADAASQTLIEVPSILTSLLVTSGPSAGVEIDASLSAVSDWVDLLIANGVTSPFAVDIVSLLIAYRQSRV